MNILDYFLIIVIVLLVIFVILYLRKHKGSCGDCGSCHVDCHRPALYKAYRKDHPLTHDKES